MRLVEFLNEDMYKELSEDDVLNILKTKCKNNWKAIQEKKVPIIYRGDRKLTRSFGLFDGKDIRKSANTSNYYTILFSQILKSWNKIPKRDHALICSTSNGIASSYGYDDAFIIVPFDSTLVAYAETDDFWDITYKSYKFTLPELNHNFEQMKINDEKSDIEKFLQLKISDTVSSKYDDKITDLIYYLIKFFLNKKVEHITQNFTKFNAIEEIKEKIVKKQGDSKLYDVFDWCLSPDKLSINTAYYNNIPKTKNNEVWIDSNCVVLNKSKFVELWRQLK